MKQFKGTPGKWELYGVTNKSLLQGLVPPDYYQIRCNGKTIADKIEDRADAQLLLTSKKMLKMLIYLIDDEQLSSSAMEDEIKQLIKEATEI